MSTALAYYVHDAGVLEPLSAVDITVRDAFAAVKSLCDPDVLYDIEFDERDGLLFKRFSRRLPVEVWLVATPVNEDGTKRRDHDAIVSAMAFTQNVTHGIGDTFAAKLKNELAALVEADA